MKRRQATSDELVPVSEKISTNQIDKARDDAQDPECPAQTQAWDNRAHSQRVHQSTEARSSGGDTHCKATPFQKPLWSDAHAPDEEEAHAPAEADALTEKDVPFLRGQGGADEGECFEEDAEIDDEARAKDLNEICG